MNKTVMLAAVCAALLLGGGGLMAEQAPPEKEVPPKEEVVPKDEGPPAKDVSAWHVGRSQDPIDDSETITLALPVESENPDPRHTPALVLRCANKKLALFINWAQFVGTGTTHVDTRFDSGPATSDIWNISTDGTATFHYGPKATWSPAKREAGTVAFIRSMLTANQLTARVTPYREGPKVAVFKLYGLGGLIQTLWKTCGLDENGDRHDDDN